MSSVDRRAVRRRRSTTVVASALALLMTCGVARADAGTRPSTPAPPSDGDIDIADIRARLEADLANGVDVTPVEPADSVSTRDVSSTNRVEATDPTGDAIYPEGDLYKAAVEVRTTQHLQLYTNVATWSDLFDADWELDTGPIWYVETTGDFKDDMVAALFTVNNESYGVLYSVINGNTLGPLVCEASAGGSSSVDNLFGLQFPGTCLKGAARVRFQAEFRFTKVAAPNTTSVDFAPNSSYSDWLYNTPPGQPTAVAALPGLHSMSLTWTAPADPGNTLITDYVIQYSSNNGVSWTTFDDVSWSTEQSATVTGLANLAYRFRVAAVNNAGTGPFSNPTSAITPYNVPTPPDAAPGRPWASPGVQSALVEWSPPASFGSSPLTEYQVHLSTDGGTTWSQAAHGSPTELSVEVHDLENATSYVFRVRSVSALGNGPWSLASSPVTTFGTPATPAAPTVLPTAGGAWVQWDPVDDGGSPISTYSVEYREDVPLATWSSFEVTCPGPPCTHATIAGLTDGTEYEVNVAAVNAVGAGSWGPSSFFTAGAQDHGTSPGAPTNVVASPLDGRATVTWTAPADDGGAAIADYRVTVTDNVGGVATGVTGPVDRYVGSATTTLTFTGLTNGTQYRFEVEALNVNGLGATSDLSAAVTPGPQDYVAVEPTRLLDTRTGAKPAANSVVELPVAGSQDVPADALAVALNVTVVAPTANGFVTVYPCDESRPNASNVNYIANVNIPNLVMAKPAANGKVCLYTSQSAHLIVDVSGYMPAPAPYTALSPARLLDTRPSGETVDDLFEKGGTVAANTFVTLDVNGRGGVANDAVAVVLNVTAVNPASNGFMTVYPCDASRPNASNLNFRAGVNIANLVIMRPSASGEVCLYTSQTTHVIVDAAGYMPAETSYTPLVPGRLLDTRGTGQTVDDIWEKSGRKFGNSTISLYVGDRGGLSDDGGAVVLNVTAVGPGTSGFITVYACDVSRPNASNLNYISGVTIPNLVVVSPSADGHVCLYTSGETDLVVDVLGSFEPV